jgi:Uma2 family endonuclease
MAQPARKAATYADVAALPENVVGEILDGELVTSPRPSIAHARVTSRLGSRLGRAFDDDDGSGPGGWILLDEHELQLASDVIVPNVAGYRRERMPELPQGAFLTMAPDWVCEALSPSTEAIDRGRKRRIYAREGVRHLWFINPSVRTLEVHRIEGDTYRIVATHTGDEIVRAEPFDAIELPLARLWER